MDKIGLSVAEMSHSIVYELPSRMIDAHRFRAVLMDQDVVHRVSTPSPLAGIPSICLLIYCL